jgi:archaellum component FlaC
MEAAQHTGMNNNQPNDNTRFDRLEALIRSQVGGLRAEVNGLKDELGGLKGELGGLTFALGDVKDEVGGLKDEVGGLTAEVSGLNVRLDTLHGQIKIVAEGHRALVDNITDVKGGIGRLEAGQDHLQLRMIAVESRLGLTR